MILHEDMITESAKVDKFWYLEGVFAQAEVGNRNGRIYPEKILGREMDKYITNLVSQSRAVGELSHPQSKAINPDRASILIESLDREKNDWFGRAKVLGTGCGQTLQALLEGGVKLGVSTRGCGDTKKRRDGLSEVANNYEMITIDAVLNPSAPDAFTKAILENENVMDSVLMDNLLYEEFIGFLKTKKQAKFTADKVKREKLLIEAVQSILGKL